MIDQAIDYMEFGKFRGERFIDELSGGQRRRAYIAMVIAQELDIYLIKFNKLDIYHASRMIKIVRCVMNLEKPSF